MFNVGNRESVFENSLDSKYTFEGFHSHPTNDDNYWEGNTEIEIDGSTGVYAHFLHEEQWGGSQSGNGAYSKNAYVIGLSFGPDHQGNNSYASDSTYPVSLWTEALNCAEMIQQEIGEEEAGLWMRGMMGNATYKSAEMYDPSLTGKKLRTIAENSPFNFNCSALEDEIGIIEDHASNIYYEDELAVHYGNILQYPMMFAGHPTPQGDPDQISSYTWNTGDPGWNNPESWCEFNLVDVMDSAGLDDDTIYSMGFSWADITNYGYDCDITDDGTVDNQFAYCKCHFMFQAVEMIEAPYSNYGYGFDTFASTEGWSKPVFKRCVDSAEQTTEHSFMIDTITPNGTSVSDYGTSTLKMQFYQGYGTSHTLNGTTDINEVPTAGITQTLTVNTGQTYNSNINWFVNDEDGSGKWKVNYQQFASNGIWPDWATEDDIYQAYFVNGGWSFDSTDIILNVDPNYSYIEGDSIGGHSFMNALSVNSPSAFGTDQDNASALTVDFNIHNTPATTTSNMYLRRFGSSSVWDLGSIATPSAGAYSQVFPATGIGGGGDMATIDGGNPLTAGTMYFVQVECGTGTNHTFARSSFFTVSESITGVDILTPSTTQNIYQGDTVTVTYKTTNNLTNNIDPEI